jgi:hypothetical protein
MSRYNRYLDQTHPNGLPGDDFTRLCQQDRLNTHFQHRGNQDAALPEPPRSAYRDAGISQSQRSRISEVRGATRAALGSSFDFIDDSYERSRRRDDDYHRSRGWLDKEPRRDPIPQKYQDEFNKLWHEDDMANDADRYRDDYTSPKNAPWREHVMLDRNGRMVGPDFSRPPIISSAPRRVDSVIDSCGFRRPASPPRQASPVLVSKFSFESLADSVEEAPPRRRYFGRFRRD